MAFDETSMKVSPHAGKPAEASMLVNVPRLAITHNTECLGGDNVPEWNRKPF